MRNTAIGRRRVVRTIGGTIGLVGLAGCAGEETARSDTPGSDEPAEESTDDGSNADETAETDGNTPVDRTGQQTVTVAVGTGTTGLEFDPAEIQVSPGTTVIWEWTGVGGGHNVVSSDGNTFASHEHPETTAEEGYQFEQTFDEVGSYDYECTIHVAMEGTVTVVE